jgi:2-keto-4-pentenoate hydratase/2-oxohepta-3-ene-1,7-dioic acid hydratase in catechol pathway
MRLVSFTDAGGPRLALALDGEPRAHNRVLAADVRAVLPGCPSSLAHLLPALDQWHPRLEAAAATAPRILIEPASIAAPIPEPRHFFAVGLNYEDHALEMGRARPSRPCVFNKLPGSIHPPFAAVSHPGFSDTLDYEGELAVVVARKCRNVSEQHAHEYLAGYLIVNDLSVREYVNPDTLVLAKGCDEFAPQGPWLTTKDEIGDAQHLRIQTWVNDELRQDDSTSRMIFPPAVLLSWCSRGITLQPGDLISTGSPRGSGHGMQPPRYLRPGDRVKVRVEKLGWIDNTIGPAI